MVNIGQRVRFVPGFIKSGTMSEEEKRKESVTGKVSYVNRRTKTFWVKYPCGNTTMTETFKFTDIGSEVKVLG